MKNFISIFALLLLSKFAVASRPGKEYKIFPDSTYFAEDKSFRIEQYANDDWDWQIWIFPYVGKNGQLLTRPDDFSGYAAYFQVSPNGKWLLHCPV